MPSEPVNCEQDKCRGQGKDEQFYCSFHGQELCSICRFAHTECESKGLLLRGSRKDNGSIIVKDSDVTCKTTPLSECKALVIDSSLKIGRINQITEEHQGTVRLTVEALTGFDYNYDDNTMVPKEFVLVAYSYGKLFGTIKITEENLEQMLDYIRAEKKKVYKYGG